jgi:taurine dioxygenase
MSGLGQLLHIDAAGASAQCPLHPNHGQHWRRSERDRVLALNVIRWEQLYPPAVHPVVRVHPVTGRKVLFVNPQFTVAIKNMDERESRSLLDILFQQAQIPEYQFRHHWTPHTLVMWDNRSTQHYAVNDYFPQRRYMERVTIKGGPVNGVERADPETVRKAIRRTTGRPPDKRGKPLAPITPETSKV